MSTRLVAAAAFVASFGLASGGAIGAEPGSEPAAPAVSIQMDVGHFGVTAFGTPLTYPLSEAWRLQFDGPVSYPLIANGRVFVTVGNANEYGTTLFALDAKTGQSLWSQSITGTYFWSAAAYDSGQVFVLSFDGLLKAFDEKTGVMNWSVQVANEYFVTSPPVAGNGVVYVEGDGSDTLTAYLETSGALIWTQGIEAGDGAPALSSEGIYTYSPCQVYAFHPISGRPLWHYAGDCDGGGGTTPVYRNNSLYISDPAGSGNQIFNAATGAITGTFDTNALPPTISRGVAYYLASGTLEAVDLSSNKVLWNFAGDGGLAQLPIEVNGKIFIGSTSGLLWVLDAFTGKQVWSTNVGAPIAPNGCCTGPNTGLAASGGIVVVPASDILVAYH
jgi:outer membrane protein assembly factor BamB